ncbi:MAG: hypothetical protein M1813_002827 [Trichoglossum hirsutum]|jgi:hypothetical protein|nr:MAG: hypothetical protein M1813_002827 [Trichoglossum hirsutum]
MARNGYHGLMGPPEPPRPVDPPVTGYMANRQMSSSSSMPLTSLFPHQTQPSDMSRCLPAALPPPSEAHAMVRWQTDSEEPWNPVRTEGVPGVRTIPFVRSGTRSLGSFSQYRDNNVSEVESVDTGTHPSDSGYVTKSLTPSVSVSVFSGEPAEYGLDCHSVSGQIDSLHLVSEQNQCSPQYRPSDRPRSVSANVCDLCGNSFTCQSALKYARTPNATVVDY